MRLPMEQEMHQLTCSFNLRKYGRQPDVQVSLFSSDDPVPIRVGYDPVSLVFSQHGQSLEPLRSDSETWCKIL